MLKDCALAVVGDDETDAVGGAVVEGDAGRIGAGVPPGVRQALLRGPVQGRRHLRRQLARFAEDLEIRSQSRRPVFRHKSLQRIFQMLALNRRRPQG